MLAFIVQKHWPTHTFTLMGSEQPLDIGAHQLHATKRISATLWLGGNLPLSDK
jgi:hypothetical protein